MISQKAIIFSDGRERWWIAKRPCKQCHGPISAMLYSDGSVRVYCENSLHYSQSFYHFENLPKEFRAV